MKTSLFHLALASATFSCSVPLLQPVVAQEAPVANQTITERIVMQNVSPDIMAWWLDRAHQTEPMAFQVSRHNTEGVLPPSAIDPGKPLGDYQLPEGVKRIFPLGPRNTLIVEGTPAGISKLKEAIAILDKSLPQMEIEIQYVYMDEADFKKFGVTTLNQSAEAGPFKWGVLPDQVVVSDASTTQPVALNYQDRLGEMVQKGKAQLATAPRVTAINNCAAALRSTTSRPIVLNSLEWPTVDNTQVVVFMKSSLGFNVRPTINPDETMDLVLAPGLSLAMEVYGQKNDGPVQNGAKKETTVSWRRQLGGVQTLRNVQDGQTILLTGQDAANLLPPLTNFKSKKSTTLANNKVVGSLFSKSAEFKPKKSTQLFLFVTPRIVRRLTADKPVVTTPPTT